MSEKLSFQGILNHFGKRLMLPRIFRTTTYPKTLYDDGVEVNQNDVADVFGRFFEKKLNVA
jgi:hypothetical protein